MAVTGTELDQPSRGAAPRRTLPQVAGVTLAIGAGLAVGALTAYGQGWLADDLGSLANSAGPWAITAFVVAMLAPGAISGAVWAAIALGFCEVGYVLAVEVRGAANATSTVVFWLTAAALAGPPLGVAGAWTPDTSRWYRASTGPAVLAGVLIGEGITAFVTVRETTNATYWVFESAVGAVVLALCVVRIVRLDLRPTWGVPVSIATATAAAGALAATVALVS